MTTNQTNIPEPTSPTEERLQAKVAAFADIEEAHSASYRPRCTRSRSGGGVMSYTQPPTATNEYGFEGKHWRTMGGDLTLFEYLRRDFGASKGWHPGMFGVPLLDDAQGHEFWRQPEKFAQTALMGLHDWAAVHDHQLHDLLERHEDLCLGMGPCDRSGVES